MPRKSNVAERHSLLSRYDKLYIEKYQVKPTYNRNIEQWASSDLIESYTLLMCYRMLEYYFIASTRHDWQNFVYSADKVYKNIVEQDKDKEERFVRRGLAKRWLSE
jgi:hypothetical protein